MKRIESYIVSLSVVLVLFTHWQAKALGHEIKDGESKPDSGVGPRFVNYAPSDSSFSVKLGDSKRLLNDRTTLIVNMGMYKQLKYIKVYDMIGKKVFFQSLPYSSGVVKINMSLKPGIYFCSVYSSKGLVETRKVINF